MKDKLTLRNVLICCAAFFAVLVFVFSFLTAFRVSSGNDWSEYRNIIWGCNGQRNSDGSAQIYAANDRLGAAALPLVGAILALVGGLGACLSLLLVKDAKVAKICLIVCGALLVVGGVLFFFTVAAYALEASKRTGVSIEDMKKAAEAAGTKTSSPLGLVSGILGIAGGLSVCGAALVK